MTREAVTNGREAAIQQLRDVGLRVTSPRLEVLQVLAAGGHLDVEDLTAAARERLGTLTSQAVYEMLRHFLETGLVTKFERPGRPAVFELSGQPHQHALCVNCGRVENVAHKAPVLPGNHLRDWQVKDADIVFKGLCPDCRSTSESVG
ncbi:MULTISPECIES: Fur family transcriptional regulator [Streptomyces]|uniref:Fur family transcriptional regulator n=1 Tax=Streptomyces chilikensis TaxID=1194079 RepID=A0ABV3EZ38_9ACTN|nr:MULTISPECIES: Fur family transcriptional regulator [Streptomyces]MDH6223959.1 Fe2+ or Zn2+ uptake regulation protein [Streptomyces sp. MJP52]